MFTEKKYFKPKTAEEAMKIANEYSEDFNFIAGGTDIIVNKYQGNNSSSCLIDISEVDEMTEIIIKGKHLIIGAAVKLEDLKMNSCIVNEFPAIVNAANAVASPVIRKTATLGGNLLCENRCIFYNQTEWWREAAGYCLKCDGDVCIATGGRKNCFSKFVSDMAVILISMDARIEVCESYGSYISPLEDIYTREGINPHIINKTAIIKAIQIPLNKGFKSVFKKLRQRESIDFGSLTTSVTINTSGKIKIVLGCMDPGPVIIEGSINDNKTELIKKAIKKCRTIDNDVFSRKYRKEMITVFLKRSFNELQLNN